MLCKFCFVLFKFHRISLAQTYKLLLNYCFKDYRQCRLSYWTHQLVITINLYITEKKSQKMCGLGVSFTLDLTMAMVKLAHITSTVEADYSPLWSLLDIVPDILLPLFYFLVLLNNIVYHLRLCFLARVVEMLFPQFVAITHIWKLVIKHAYYSFELLQSMSYCPLFSESQLPEKKSIFPWPLLSLSFSVPSQSPVFLMSLFYF